MIKYKVKKKKYNSLVQMGDSLSSTLSRSGISKVDAYGLVAVLAFGMTSFGIAMLATGSLWRSKWFEKIYEDFGWFGASLHPWLQGFCWMAFSISLPVSFFLYMQRFVEKSDGLGGFLGNPGDFTWVFGWYMATMFCAFFVPLMLANFRSTWVAFAFHTLMEFSMLWAFSYLFIYTHNDYQHLTMSSPPQWVLLFPVAWGFFSWCQLLAISWYASERYDGEGGRLDERNDRSTYSEVLASKRGMEGNEPNQTEIVYQQLLGKTSNQYAINVNQSPSPAVLGGYTQVNPSNTASQMREQLSSITSGGDFGLQNTANRHQRRDHATGQYI